MNTLSKLAEAVGYPEKVAEDVSVYAFRVDGGDCIAEKTGSRLVLKRKLGIGSADLPLFAGYAAGRMLREEAVLAWDERSESAWLWQEIPSGAGEETMRSVFADFADSCDWWAQRAADVHAPPDVFPDIMIRP